MGGHEFTGTIAGIGTDVSDFAIGDEVIQCYGPHCGRCKNCRNGSPSFRLERRRLPNAGGGFADFVAVLTPDGRAGLFYKPTGFPDVVAAACEPAGCAISASLRGSPEPGHWAAVVGLGAIGHFVCQTLHSMGVHVIGIDVSADRIRAADPFCDEAVDSSACDPVATVFEITAGLGADRSYEAVGISSTQAATLQMTQVGGIAVVEGVFGHPVQEFDPVWIFRRDLTVIGGKGHPLMTAQGEPLAIDFFRRGWRVTEAVVTGFPRSQAPEAFAALNAGACLKAVITN